MRLFGRDKKQQVQARPVPGHDDLMMLPDQQIEPILIGLTDIVLEGVQDYPFTDEHLRRLQVGLPYLTQRECSRDTVLAGQTVARLGYLSRAAEFAKFEAAREADLDLLDVLTAKIEASDGGEVWDAASELAAAMVRSESIDPSPDEGGPSWTVPGLGGQIRGKLRDGHVAGIDRPSDVTSEELKRTWKYGYFLRVLEEFLFEERMQH